MSRLYISEFEGGFTWRLSECVKNKLSLILGDDVIDHVISVIVVHLWVAIDQKDDSPTGTDCNFDSSYGLLLLLRVSILKPY